MKFEQYMEQIKQKIKQYLPSEFQDLEATLLPQKKNNNRIVHGITLQNPEGGMYPVLYLENYYGLYQKGMDMEENLKRIGRDYVSAQNSMEPQYGMDLSYAYRKDNLFLCVVNEEKNQDLLRTVPHQNIEDLAVMYRIMACEKGEQTGSILVNNQLLKKWGVTQEEVHKQALQNMGRLFQPGFCRLDTRIFEMMGGTYGETGIKENVNDLFVLTNQFDYYGAGYLCCPDILKGISEKIDGDFLILPCSVHELIIMKETEGTDISYLADTVREINQDVVGEEDYLSDTIYRYDSQSQTLSAAEGNDMQQGMKMQ